MSMPSGRVLGEEGSLLLREDLLDGLVAEKDLADFEGTRGAHRSGAHKPPRHRVDLDAEARVLAERR